MEFVAVGEEIRVLLLEGLGLEWRGVCCCKENREEEEYIVQARNI